MEVKTSPHSIRLQLPPSPLRALLSSVCPWVLVLKICGCGYRCVFPSPLWHLAASATRDLTSNACPSVLVFCVSFDDFFFSCYLTWLQAHTSCCCCLRICKAHRGWGSAQSPKNTKRLGHLWLGPYKSRVGRLCYVTLRNDLGTPELPLSHWPI